MNDREIDQIKVRLYKEFQEENKSLKKKSLLDYYAQQGQYVNRRLQEELNKVKENGRER